MTNRLNDLHTQLRDQFGSTRVRQDELLAKHCNWRVGGPADLFVRCDSAEELITAVRAAQASQVPVTIIGFGANILVSDKGVRGLVVLNRAQRITFLGKAALEADSGANLAILAKEAAKHGIGGLEFLIGIPGTVGGAVTVNAGTRTEWISTVVRAVRVLRNDGKLAWLQPAQLGYAYRNSILKQTGEVVVTAKLQGSPNDPRAVAENMARHLQVRKHQPTGPSTGSVFTNPAGDFAGRLIEAAGLKGFQIGGAKVSEMHANFILNVGQAQAADMQAVIEHIKREVQRRCGVKLEEEIRYVGEW